MPTEPAPQQPAESAPLPEPLLLPASTATASAAARYVSGIAALVLTFFTGASLTVAYLSSSSPAAASQPAAAAAAADSFAGISLLAKSAYVLDLATNRALFSRNADTQLPLASLTKVPLILAVSDVLPPEALIRIPPHTPPDGASVRLPEGLRFSVQDLVDFTLVASSNEGADILTTAAAEGVRAKYPQTAATNPVLSRMNDIARELGLSKTYFLNTSGLDMSDTQAGAYGSAHDMALLFAHAASTSPAFFQATTRSTTVIRAESGETVNAANTDEALPVIPAVVFGKTGYTELAGGNLAVVFEAGPAHPVVIVVLGSTQRGRFEDMEKLVDAALFAIAAKPR